jgi:hypothetical protein
MMLTAHCFIFRENESLISLNENTLKKISGILIKKFLQVIPTFLENEKKSQNKNFHHFSLIFL